MNLAPGVLSSLFGPSNHTIYPVTGLKRTVIDGWMAQSLRREIDQVYRHRQAQGKAQALPLPHTECGPILDQIQRRGPTDFLKRIAAKRDRDSLRDILRSYGTRPKRRPTGQAG